MQSEIETREQLLRENAGLRQRIAELERSQDLLFKSDAYQETKMPAEPEASLDPVDSALGTPLPEDFDRQPIELRNDTLSEKVAKLESEVESLKQAEEVLYRARNELDLKVNERTRDLQQANADLQAEIAERQILARQRKQLLASERAARLAAEASEERSRLLIEGVKDYAIFGLHTDGRVISWNQGAERMKGYREAEIIGSHFSCFYTEEDNKAGKPEALLRLAVAEGRSEQQGWRVRRDGTQFWADVVITAIRNPDGQLRGFSKVTRDITRRMLAEREREELLEREQISRREAEEANRLKDEFLATVSHELRTPLNAILGWSTLLQRGTMTATATSNALATIERNAKAQNQLINDILDVSRIVLGKLNFEAEPVEPALVLFSALEAVRPTAEAKGVVVDSVLDGATGLMLGDADRLQQVFWNLLSNAIKFTPEGGRVEVRLERVGERVTIQVRDNGQGIDPAFLPHIFDRFRQADSTSTRRFGGLGLGLSIVHHLVELHGGTVRAASAGPGQGATFTVSLPLVSAPLAPALPEQTPAVPPGLLGGIRVLVVDDEVDSREMVEALLKEYGAETLSVASVQEALPLVERWKPSVLLGDIGMAEEDGYDLITRVRALKAEQGGQTPAAALTPYTRTADQARALAAGYQFHLPKPVNPTELLVVIASLAGRAIDG